MANVNNLEEMWHEHYEYFEELAEQERMQTLKQKNKVKEIASNLGANSEYFSSLGLEQIVYAGHLLLAITGNDKDEICPSCGENVKVFDNKAECYECKTISKKTENDFLVITELV